MYWASWHVKSLQLHPNFVTLWTVARQAPLATGFSRQEYWSGLPFASPVDLSNPGIESTSLKFPALADGFFVTSTTTSELYCPCLKFTQMMHSLFYTGFPFSVKLALIVTQAPLLWEGCQQLRELVLSFPVAISGHPVWPVESKRGDPAFRGHPGLMEAGEEWRVCRGASCLSGSELGLFPIHSVMTRPWQDDNSVDKYYKEKAR